MIGSREYTREEIQELFLERVWILVNYWSKIDKPKEYCLSGLAFSLLSEIDGENDGTLPGFLLIPNPGMEDKDYFVQREENYFPYIFGDETIDDLIDIGGNLHEKFYPSESKTI